MKRPAVLEEVRRWSVEMGERIAKEDPRIGISALGRLLGAFAHSIELFGWGRAEKVIAEVAEDAQAKVNDARTAPVSRGELS